MGFCQQRVSKARGVTEAGVLTYVGARRFGRMCGWRKRLKEESSASSRLCALWRIFPKLAGVTEAGVLTYVVIICKRGELASSCEGTK